jgi:hypothetical protein
VIIGWPRAQILASPCNLFLKNLFGILGACFPNNVLISWLILEGIVLCMASIGTSSISVTAMDLLGSIWMQWKWFTIPVLF